MFRNEKYIYGTSDLNVPANLNLADYIIRSLVDKKDRIAVINAATDEKLKYCDIVDEGIKLAVSLARIGLRKREVVAICSENRFEYWSSFLGVICNGAVFTTINVGYTKGELVHVMKISKPAYIFCSPSAYKSHAKHLKLLPFLKKIIIYGEEKFPNTLSFNQLIEDGRKMNVSLDNFDVVDVKGQRDTAVVLYSSGTTGLPKGVMLTHLNILASCCGPSVIQDEKPVSFGIAPWYHAFGLIGTTVALCNGRTNIFMPKFEVDAYLRTIEKYKVTHLSVVPPVLVAVTKTQHKYDLSSVKMIFCGAAPLRREIIEAVNKMFPNTVGVQQGYGMTETTLGVIRDYASNAEKSKSGSVGQVVGCTVIKIVDLETRKPLGPNQKGELLIKSVLNMKGYIGRDMKDECDEEGFFKTGDIAYYDDDKYFYIVDRLKELIKYKAYQVPPAEIEAVILSHPSVKDVGVLGIPRSDAGEVPLACVVRQEGATVTEKEIIDFVKENLSNPKHLRGGVRFVEEIPKNPSGKILRRALKEMVKSKKSKL